VALTANAKKSDQELYLKEGMSDYLSKPFKEQELLQKLAKVLNLKSSPEVEINIEKKGEGPKKEQEFLLYNLDELKKITRGDEVFFKKIIELFIENTPPSAEKMIKAMKEEKWEQVGMIAHKMRPSFAHMGMKGMAEELREIEDNASEKKNLERTKELVEDFFHKSETVIEQLEELVNHHH
nr:Hpt domain-containing protein [Bacteroidota bacterium]